MPASLGLGAHAGERSGKGPSDAGQVPTCLIDLVEQSACVMHHGVVLARSAHAIALRSGSGRPLIFFPPQDVDERLLAPSTTLTLFDGLGVADSLDIAVPGHFLPDGAFIFRMPDPAVAEITDYICFDLPVTPEDVVTSLR